MMIPRTGPAKEYGAQDREQDQESDRIRTFSSVNVLVAAFIIVAVINGTVHSSDAFVEILKNETNASGDTIAAIGTAEVFIAGAGSPLGATLVHLHGPRAVCIVGSLVSALGMLIVTILPPTVYGFFIIQSLLSGMGFSLAYLATLVGVKETFLQRRFTALAAKDLQIKKLAEGIIMGNPSKPVDDDHDDITNQDTHENSEDQAENEYAGRSYSSIADEIINLDIPGSDELGSGKQLQYKCEECEASYKHRASLRNHIVSKHESVLYSCKYCEYKATQRNSLKKHQESIHEGVKYPCNYCDYQFVFLSNPLYLL